LSTGGTVVAVEQLAGVVRTRDVVILVHAGVPVTAACRGVEVIRADRRKPGAPIGLLLPEVETFEPIEGDYVTDAPSSLT
jgi:hypothetical protein